MNVINPCLVDRKRKNAEARKRQRTAKTSGLKAIPNGTQVNIETFEKLNAHAGFLGIALGEVIDTLVIESQIDLAALAVIPEIQEALGVESHAEAINVMVKQVAASNPILQTIRKRAFGESVACDTGSGGAGVRSLDNEATIRLLGNQGTPK